MSAVPKKKLCWNCEGNVSANIDNCPYCAVYLHPSELEENASWNPSYRSSKKEEIPPPPYQIRVDGEQTQERTEEFLEEGRFFNWHVLFAQLKRDIFPILFLMMGSIFFLFGIVLLLFSQNGTLTLQWQESHAFYFLLFAFPLIGFGWKFFQQLDNDH